MYMFTYGLKYYGTLHHRASSSSIINYTTFHIYFSFWMVETKEKMEPFKFLPTTRRHDTDDKSIKKRRFLKYFATYQHHPSLIAKKF